jgi:hypothetical protein
VPPQTFGADTDAVLHELYLNEEIAALCRKEVV